jgi:predicted ABC-type ATPase
MRMGIRLATNCQARLWRLMKLWGGQSWLQPSFQAASPQQRFMRPRMIVVAGPPGSGKSALFPVHSFEIDYFNADDRSAQPNGGSYKEFRTRTAVNPEFEHFVEGHIQRGISFAIKTTLRSDITFIQMDRARFELHMLYVAVISA